MIEPLYDSDADSDSDYLRAYRYDSNFINNLAPKELSNKSELQFGVFVPTELALQEAFGVSSHAEKSSVLALMREWGQLSGLIPEINHETLTGLEQFTQLATTIHPTASVEHVFLLARHIAGLFIEDDKFDHMDADSIHDANIRNTNNRFIQILTDTQDSMPLSGSCYERELADLGKELRELDHSVGKTEYAAFVKCFKEQLSIRFFEMQNRRTRGIPQPLKFTWQQAVNLLDQQLSDWLNPEAAAQKNTHELFKEIKRALQAKEMSEQALLENKKQLSGARNAVYLSPSEKHSRLVQDAIAALELAENEHRESVDHYQSLLYPMGCTFLNYISELLGDSIDQSTSASPLLRNAESKPLALNIPKLEYECLLQDSIGAGTKNRLQDVLSLAHSQSNSVDWNAFAVRFYDKAWRRVSEYIGTHIPVDTYKDAPKEYMYNSTREDSSGVKGCFMIGCIIEQIDISTFSNDATFKHLLNLVCLILCLDNDIVSVEREADEKDFNNLVVSRFMQLGGNINAWRCDTDIFEQVVGEITNKRDDLLSQMFHMKEGFLSAVGDDSADYHHACRAVALMERWVVGNIVWSARNPRYNYSLLASLLREHN